MNKALQERIKLSAKAILEKIAPEELKAELERLDSLLKSVDVRSKHRVAVSPFSNRAVLKPKYFCADCGKRLRTRGAKRCNICNMRLVGKNHILTRKNKGRLF